MNTAITRKLDQLKIKYKIKPHRMPAFTSEDAARERCVRLSQIVKTMLLMDGSGRIVVAVLPGNRRLDIKALKKVTKAKDLRFVDREIIERRLGFVTGAIAPIAEFLEGMLIFVDPSVFIEEMVDISSGDPRAGLELNSSDFEKLLSRATITGITKKG
jgi:Cys-tRNA(Pro) deacylase